MCGCPELSVCCRIHNHADISGAEPFADDRQSHIRLVQVIGAQDFDRPVQHATEIGRRHSISKTLNNAANLTQAREVDGDHGRIETRSPFVCTKVDWLNEHKWPDLVAVCKVVPQREINRVTTSEMAYYLLSAPLSVSRFDEAATLYLQNPIGRNADSVERFLLAGAVARVRQRGAAVGFGAGERKTGWAKPLPRPAGLWAL